MKEPKFLKKIKRAPPLVEGGVGAVALVAPLGPVIDVVAVGLIADATRKTPGGKNLLKGIKGDIKDVRVAVKEIEKIYPKDMHVGVKTVVAIIPDKTIKATAKSVRKMF